MGQRAVDKTSSSFSAHGKIGNFINFIIEYVKTRQDKTRQREVTDAGTNSASKSASPVSILR